jgi:hypothetical protein
MSEDEDIVHINIDEEEINDKWLRVNNTKLKKGMKLEDIPEAKIGTDKE